MATAVLTVTPVGAEETRPLRHLVLRPGQPVGSTVYAGDDDPEARHWAALDDGRVVGVASLYREPRPGGPEQGWRLRGMATAPDARRRGVGRALLAAAVEHVAAHGGGELWANARLGARDFYLARGFRVEGDEFHIDGIGPHVVMRLDVAPSA